jgi:hypothetical protein
MQRRHVLAAHVFAGTEPIGRHGPTGVHPGRVDLQRHARDVQYERHACLGESCPDRIEIVVTW